MGKLNVNKLAPASGTTLTINGDLKIDKSLTFTSLVGGSPIIIPPVYTYTSPVIEITSVFGDSIINGEYANVFSLGRPSRVNPLYKILSYESDSIYRNAMMNGTTYPSYLLYPLLGNDLLTKPLSLNLPSGLFFKFGTNNTAISKIKIYSNLLNFTSLPSNNKPKAYIYHLDNMANYDIGTNTYQSGGNLSVYAPFLSDSLNNGINTNPSFPKWTGLTVPGTYNTSQKIANIPGEPGTFYWEFDYKNYFTNTHNPLLFYRTFYNYFGYINVSDTLIRTDTSYNFDQWLSTYFTILIRPNYNWGNISLTLNKNLKFYYTIEYGCCTKPTDLSSLD